MAIPGRTVVPRAARPLSGVSPIAFRTIAEQIAGSIREAIAQGRIPPAARLLELSLAREMGTSRAPVREALSQLEREGLVVKEPNRGARVVELTEEMVREVASLRGLLEGFAASLAAERLTPTEFKTLDAILLDMDGAAQQGEYARLVELDYQFHAFICRASGHRTLYETWTVISGKVRLYLSTTNLMYRDLKAVVRGHGEILAALRSRDTARANRVMQEHLGEMLNDFVAKIARTGRGGGPKPQSATFQESRRARRLAVARLSRRESLQGKKPQ
ncbi:MAG TPA: GntR family transcriptional regulator [Candidatus Methylomirabilis sp.]